jgi:3-hydroxybutyrate dehydrogenase
MADLTGKTALITGSVQGIGYGIASALAAAGARIVLHGLPEDAKAESACDAMINAGAPEVKYVGADVSEPENIDQMMAEITAWCGVDILVNNAGIQHPAAIADYPRKYWDAILAVNLSACFHTMQAVLPTMAERGYGRVINIASVQGLIGSVNKGPYVAAKHGLVGLSKVAALEYATAGTKSAGGVTVNCICPGWTETELILPQIEIRQQQIGGSRDEAIADLLKEKQPTCRSSDPAEMGALALWLCDPIAHNVTGTQIPIDGGWTAQ